MLYLEKNCKIHLEYTNKTMLKNCKICDFILHLKFAWAINETTSFEKDTSPHKWQKQQKL